MAEGTGAWVSEKKRVGFITQDDGGDIAWHRDQVVE